MTVVQTSELRKCICQIIGKRSEGKCPHCNDTGVHEYKIEVKPVPYVDTCIEHAYGTTYRLPFQIRVF